jgi:hypothetical protein
MSLSNYDNNESNSTSHKQEQVITASQMQEILSEQNRKHEESLKYQEEMFRAQLEQNRQATNNQTQNSSKNNSISIAHKSPNESSSNTSRSRHSQSIIIPEKKWSNSFRENLEKQQSTIKEKLAKRQHSSSQRKIFEYSTDLKQDLSNVVNKRMNSFQRNPYKNGSAVKPKHNIKNDIPQGLSTLALLNKPMDARGRNASMRTVTKEDSLNSNMTNSNSIISSLVEQKNNTNVLNCTSSTVQNYLEYRHMITKDKLSKLRSDKMKEELSK